MLRVALTGGIGCGKTTVAELFEKHGVPVIDTDVVARELVLPGQPAWQAVIQHFGNQVVSDNQHIDRKQLAHIVFNDIAERQWLENLLHPLIRDSVKQQIKQLSYPYCIVVIPLLFETAQQSDYDRVLLVDCPRDAQIHRIRERDGRSAEEISQIIQAQVDTETRQSGADDIITNSGSLDELAPVVYNLHQQYLLLGQTSAT